MKLQFCFPALQHYKDCSNFQFQKKALFLTLTTTGNCSFDADSIKKKTKNTQQNKTKNPHHYFHKLCLRKDLWEDVEIITLIQNQNSQTKQTIINPSSIINLLSMFYFREVFLTAPSGNNI